MERVYLILRNNQQTGPFTIGELLQQQLKPSDMIWIEGKSTAWTYLSELELIPFVKKSEVAREDIRIKSSDEIERKAEELRQRILASAPKTHFPQYTTQIESYASPYKLSPEDEIEFVDIRKERRAKRNSVLGELVLTCFVIGLFMLGIYKGKSFLGAGHKVQNSVATQLNSHDQHAAQKKKTIIQTNQPNSVLIDTTKQVDSLLALQKSKQKIPLNKRDVTDSATSHLSQPVVTTLKPQEKNIGTSTSDSANENGVEKKDTPLKKEMVSPVPEIKTANEPVKEKKGFLRGLFKKKHKENADNSQDKEE
jgi:hypothetical protein